MQIIRTGGLLYVCVDAVSRTSFIDNKSELKWHKNRIKQRERVREIPDTETETERGWFSDKVGEECQQVSTGPDSQQLLTSRLMCFHYSFSWNPELKRSKSLWSLVVNESTQHAGEAEETSRVMTFINHFTCEQAAL